MPNTKYIYYVSGCTGFLAKAIGKCLLSQFPETNVHEEKFPFIKNTSEAQKTLEYIIRQSAGRTPIIISSLVNPEIRKIFDHPAVELFDICESFLSRLENCFEAKALLMPGCSRKIDDIGVSRRAKAIDYCLGHDDGTNPDDYNKADVILLGVSRSGKTPTSVYLATHMELKSANFPLTEEILNSYQLPKAISMNIKKAVGLTTSPEILSTIRQERYPGSNYAKRSTCIQELQQASQIFQKYNIPSINTSRKSIEELAAQISQEIGLYKKTSLLKNAPPPTLQEKEHMLQKIGQLAMSKNWLSPDEVRQIMFCQNADETKFGQVAVKRNFLTHSQVESLLSIQEGLKRNVMEAVDP
jgi:[pyruvate, water dikinase]-phosphate phosphotransferase / [pyruvate, water dikinase] kinase